MAQESKIDAPWAKEKTKTLNDVSRRARNKRLRLPKDGPSPGQRNLQTLTVLSHVAAIIVTIKVIVDALHRW